MPTDSPVTPWLARLKAGDLDVVSPLWHRYYADLVRLARGHLPRAGDVDSHLVADSAFESFYRAAAAGRFPDLNDRHGLWRLLISITAQKVADTVQRRNAHKRGGKRINLGGDPLDTITDPEPTPEFAAAIAEEFQALLNRLDNEELRKIALWKMEGWTNPQIANRLGRALRTVAYKLDLIRAILQDRKQT